MTESRAAFWERIWREKAPEEVSWYESRPETSLRLIRGAGLPAGARVLDVGGGASALVDHLLDLGYRPGVLDVSMAAVERTRVRLGERAEEVEWFVEDVTGFRSPHPWEAWHDRAVLHFLVDESDRQSYRATLLDVLAPDGVAVVATFGPAGPTRCSGLPVRRHSEEDLAALLGPEMVLEECALEEHRTPSGTLQQFLACRLRRHASGDVGGEVEPGLTGRSLK